MAKRSVIERLDDLPAFPDSSAESRAYLDLTTSVLQRQSAVLGELRTRASIVLSATGIIASLLGAEGFKHPHPAVPLYAALACLGAGIVMCIAVLWPVSDSGTTGKGRQWQVTPTAGETALLAPLVSVGSEQPVSADLLRTFVTARFVNYDTIARRTDYFNIACLLLLGQLAGWSLVFLT